MMRLAFVFTRPCEMILAIAFFIYVTKVWTDWAWNLSDNWWWVAVSPMGGAAFLFLCMVAYFLWDSYKEPHA